MHKKNEADCGGGSEMATHERVKGPRKYAKQANKPRETLAQPYGIPSPSKSATNIG